MALARVGLGAVLFAPKRRFMVAMCGAGVGVVLQTEGGEQRGAGGL